MALDRKLMREAAAIAVPVAIQILFQSLFGMFDQIMVGSLGSASISAVGAAVRFVNLYTTMVGAVAATASILLAQYAGDEDAVGVGRTVKLGAWMLSGVVALFAVPSLLCPEWVMRAFSEDADVVCIAGVYLRSVAPGFAPLAATGLISAYLRTVGGAKWTMGAGVVAMAVDAALNAILIFGLLGVPAMGVLGAGLSTTIGRALECLILVGVLLFARRHRVGITWRAPIGGAFWRKAVVILLPTLIGEWVWGLGEALYGVIYGHVGTEEMAAVSATSSLQGMGFSVFVGLSTAIGVIVGGRLGKGLLDEAYRAARRLYRAGFVLSVCMAALLLLISPLYLSWFSIPAATRNVAMQLMAVYCAMLTIKVANLDMMCGILPSGGRTDYGLILNAIGTWGVGLPLGFLAAFCWRLPLPAIFLLIQSEECVRMVLGWGLMRRRKWMRVLTEHAQA